MSAPLPVSELPRRLGLLDSVSIVVGTMIGAAIFLVPNVIAQNVPSPSLILTIWALAGLVSMFGALAYAELGAMLPATGGQYVYLREAWGPMWGFLCGWTFFLAARSGGTAAVATGFAIYFSYFVPMPAMYVRITAAALILILTLVNYRGVKLGAAVQNLFTGLKVLGLALLIVSAFLSPPHGTPAVSVPTGSISAAHFGAAVIACIWAYNGWFAISLVGGEIRNPSRNLPLAILLGTAGVTVVYVLANLAYLRTLTVPEIAATERVAASTAGRTMGAAGTVVVALTILVSTFGTANGNIMTAPRLYFAQARDGLFFRPFAAIHPEFKTPHISIFGQGVWCAVLALSGTYAQLVSYATMTFWIFYALTVGGLITLRRRRPQAERPYRMSGYPVTAILFLAVALWLVVSACMSSPVTSAIGLAIVFSGVPAYYIWRRIGG